MLVISVFSFSHNVSKGFFPRVVKSLDCVVKSFNHFLITNWNTNPFILATIDLLYANALIWTISNFPSGEEGEFSPLTSAEACEKSSRWLWKEKVVLVLCEKARKHMCVKDRHDMKIC